jgi:Protein of unknown function (DUF4244)
VTNPAARSSASRTGDTKAVRRYHACRRLGLELAQIRPPDTAPSTRRLGVHRSSSAAIAGEQIGLARDMNLLKRIARRARASIDAGMTTAEYAVGTVAAVAFAVVLYKVVRSDAVSSALTSIVNSALHAI